MLTVDSEADEPVRDLLADVGGLRRSVGFRIPEAGPDLKAWDALPVEEQERVIGRSKLSDLELDDEVKPANSHVALTVIADDDGEEQPILRFNMPFGRVGTREFGTYFIGYARRPEVIEQMLTNMFIGKPPGNTDRILDFSTAVTGTLFFIPTLDFLDDPPLRSSTSAADAPSDVPPAKNASSRDPAPRAQDGSLQIGSLSRWRPV